MATQSARGGCHNYRFCRRVTKTLSFPLGILTDTFFFVWNQFLLKVALLIAMRVEQDLGVRRRSENGVLLRF